MSTPPAIRWQTLCPKRAAPPSAGRWGAEAALARTIAFLREAARAGAPMLIVVNDPARDTPTRWVLGAIAAELPAPQRPALALLVATGTHRFSDSERARFESGLLAGCGLDFTSVAWHDARASADGFSTVAAPLPAGEFRINRRVVEHEWLLAIGSLEPHYFAGVTGAHKTLTIGCLAHDDIERNHAGALHPASDLLVLDGNPVFDGAAAMMRAVGPRPRRLLAINQVALDGVPLAVACGDWRATLDELLPVARGVFAHEIAAPVDVLHLRVPLPLGRDLYQADKALKNCHRAVRDGGGIILEADCPHGTGPDAFLGLLRRASDYEGACGVVRTEGYRLGDHKAVKLRHLTDPRQRGVCVVVVSKHLPARELDGVGLLHAATATDALALLEQNVEGPLASGLVVEDAGMTCIRGLG
ncbi:MAG TPA: lactate racemase domain-containing protein, partial [Phycisphaerae bacterium]|nr:lactate racemase domain-containing protein [Phycisphaerae bacterium]